jgi:hypothetical protein
MAFGWIFALATAATPGLVPVQGRMAGVDGLPLVGTHQIVFRIYDEAEAELVEQPVTASFADGVFGATLPVDLEIFYVGGPFSMTVEFGGVESDPAPLGTAPLAAFAQRAARADVASDAEQLGGVGPGGYLRSNGVAVNALQLGGYPAADYLRGAPYSATGGVALTGTTFSGAYAAGAGLTLTGTTFAGGYTASSGIRLVGADIRADYDAMDSRYAARTGTAVSAPDGVVLGDAASCTSGNVGTIQYSGGNFLGCTPGGWVPLNAAPTQSKAAFTATGAAQTWTVPAGVFQVYAKVWGAAGGGSNAEGRQFPGGPGGYSGGAVSVSPGEVLTVIVGTGGPIGQSGATAWPNGGRGGIRGSYNVGGGGGRAALQRADGTELIVAGGGGGAGGTGSGLANSTEGGAGGGTTGANGLSGYLIPDCAGIGGTQSAGGAKPVCATQAPNLLGGAGAKNQGGHADAFIGNGTGGNVGGGGGDGYYGGSAASIHAGGGGGSGYTHPTQVSSGVLQRTTSGALPPNTGDADYASGVGVGAANAAGGAGRVVLIF